MITPTRQFKCRDCPETASSKCPSGRNVFCAHEMVTMISNTIVKKDIPFREGSESLCLQLEYGCFEPGVSVKEMFTQMVRSIRYLSDEEAEILCCNHKWYLPEGEVCDLEGHDHAHWRPETSKEDE